MVKITIISLFTLTNNQIKTIDKFNKTTRQTKILSFGFPVTLFKTKIDIKENNMGMKKMKMKCDCGGMLFVIAIEEPPKHLSKQEKLIYNRVCDVQCYRCGKIYYSQPYDSGNSINPVRKTNPLK
jgi:Zn finger protein HypA/HybF involved in hydrogenase expression